MKKIILILCLTLTSTGLFAATFNHSGVQKGSTSESCYHDPCSVSKVLQFKQLNRSAQSSMIELTLLGGEKPFNSKKVTWNRNSHKIYITCSIQAPTITFDSQVTTLPINRKMDVPSVLHSSTELYLKACHNFNGSSIQAAKRFGYNVFE